MKKATIKLLLFVCLLFAVMQTGWAQFAGMPYIGYVQRPAPPSSTMGNDFWMAFEHNNNNNATDASLYLALNIASQLPATVTITFTNNSDIYTYNLAANISRRIDIRKMVSDGNTGTTDERANVYLDATAGISNKTMHITSTQPIAVYAFNTYSATTDATVLYPIAVWGTDYYQMSYNAANTTNITNEIIIANENNTVITLSDNTTQTLSAGQAYVTNGGSADMTGRHLSSSVPVSYFAGATLFFVPSGVSFADVLDEQMLPSKVWDTAYFVPNVQQFVTTAPDSINNRIRIVSAQNGTKVTYTGATIPGITPLGATQIASGGTLNAGQWVELVISSKTGGAYIHANNPICVAGYLVGGLSGIPISDSPDGITNGNGNGGDPDNAVMPGLNQLIQQVTISPFMFPIYSTTQTGSAYTNTNLFYTNFDGRTGTSPITTQTSYPDVIHGAIILTKTAYKGFVNVVKNGTTITLTGTNWVDDAASGMSIYRYQFDNINDQNSSFTISSTVNGGGLLVLCYGLANYESYYYNAGSGAYRLQ